MAISQGDAVAQSFALAVAQYPIIADCIGGSDSNTAAESRASAYSGTSNSSNQATAQASANAGSSNAVGSNTASAQADARAVSYGRKILMI